MSFVGPDNCTTFSEIFKMQSEKVTIVAVNGNERTAWLELPGDRKPHNFALFAHCFRCAENLDAMRHISRALTLQGIGVLRFDVAGLVAGEARSLGDLHTDIGDLLVAAEYLTNKHKAPTLLIGHSLGGVASLLVAHHIPSVQAMVTISMPSKPSFLAQLGQQQTSGKLVAVSTDTEQKINVSQELAQFDQHIRRLQKPLLIMHAPFDQVVGIEHAAHLYQLAMHPKSFVSLDDADHMLTDRRHSLYAGEVMAVWAKRYMTIPETIPLLSDKQVVCRLGPDGYTTEVRAGNHGFLADEPIQLGGDDLGPSPYDLLASGLGACTAITLRMYANRKGWEVTNIKVHLQHQKVHAEDCLQCDTPTGKIDKIEREIEIEGNLTAEQRERMLQIANKCPVHRTLHSEVVVDSKLRQ